MTTTQRRQTVREMAVEQALLALADRYSVKETLNPKYNYIEARKAVRIGREYPFEKYRPRTLEEMIEDSCTIVEHDEDDELYGPMIRPLTYREAATTVIEALIRAGIIQSADVQLTTNFLCGERGPDGLACLAPIGADGTCPNHPPDVHDATQAGGSEKPAGGETPAWHRA